MKLKKVFISIEAFALILLFACNAQAAEKEAVVETVQNWEFKLDSKYFFASQTTYEFGAPESNDGKPLSRLEFPINNLWMGAELRRNFSRYSVGVRAISSVMRNTRGRMKDSDWEDSDNREIRTTFSTSSNRMEYGLIAGGDIDFKISDRLNLPPSLDVRPLIGFQWQRLAFMTHDGTQYNYWPPPEIDTHLPGNTLQFRQDYWQYILGLRGSWDMGRSLKLRGLKLLAEVNGSYVTGFNKDHHLLRGDRFSFDTTSGWGAYVSLGAQAQLTKNTALETGIDYQAIRTIGKHHLVDKSADIDETWSDAVKAWSDQIGIKLNFIYKF